MTNAVLIAAPAYSVNHPRFAVRIGAVLAQAGWDVRYVGYGSGAPSGVTVVHTFPERRQMGRLKNLPALVRLLLSSRSDVVLAAGLEAWLVAVALRRFHRCAVVGDLTEDYPATVQRWFKSAKAKGAAETLIRWCIQRLSASSNSVLLSRSALESQLALGAKSFFVPNYYPPGMPSNPPKPRDLSQPVRLIHSGILTEERGADVLAEAVELLVGRGGPRLSLHVMGSVVDEAAERCLERLRRLANDGLLELIQDPWLPYDVALQAMSRGDIGLILFQPVSDNLRNPMPNKAFDYMARGLAVIGPVWAGDFAEMVRRADAATLVDTSESAALADAITFLASHEDERYRLALAGYQQVVREWSMDRIGDSLAAHLEALAHRG